MQSSLPQFMPPTPKLISHQMVDIPVNGFGSLTTGEWEHKWKWEIWKDGTVDDKVMNRPHRPKSSRDLGGMPVGSLLPAPALTPVVTPGFAAHGPIPYPQIGSRAALRPLEPSEPKSG